MTPMTANVPKASMSGMDHNDRFLRGIFHKFLIPTILSVLGGTVNALVDSAIVGNLIGPDALAAINLCGPVFLLFSTVGALLGTGGGLLSAALIGREQEEDARRVYTLATALELACSLLIMVLGLLCLNPIVRLLGADEILRPMVKDYTRVAFFSAPVKCLLYIPFNYLRLDGKPGMVSGAMLLMTVCNGILDVVFIRMGFGMTGAAVASLLGTALGAAVGFSALRGGMFRRTGLRETGRLLRELIALGTPPALNNLLDMTRLILINRILMAAGGGGLVAIFTVVCAMSDLTLCVVSGVPQTGSPLIGVFRGERNNPAQRDLVRLELRYGLAMSGAAAVLIALLPNPVCVLFGLSASGQAALALRLFALSLPFAMVCSILIYFYNASGRVMLANIITFCRMFLFAVIPAALLAPFGAAVWLFRPIAETAALAFLFPVLWWFTPKSTFHSKILLLDERLDQAGQVIDFSVGNDPAEAALAAERIEAFCESNNMGTRRTMAVSLSIEEMLTLMMEYCYRPEENSWADVRVFVIQGVTGLRIRGAGKQFNPLEFYEAHKDEDIMGDTLGIQLVLKLAEDVRYQRTFGVNTLTVLFDRAEQESFHEQKL